MISYNVFLDRDRLPAAAEWARIIREAGFDVQLSTDAPHDGYHVLHRFTDEQPTAQIILMTGHGSAVGALDAVSSGAYDYLMKPFDKDALLEKLMLLGVDPGEKAA